MRIKHVFFIGLILISSLSYASVTFRADYREAANVFQILDCVSNWEPDFCSDNGEYRKFWKAQFGLTEEDKKFFKEYATIRSKYFDLAASDISWKIDGVFSRASEINEDRLSPYFYASRNLPEVYEKLREKLTDKELTFLKTFYAHFEKSYQKLLAESLPFKNKAAALNKNISQKKYKKFFDKISAYYNVTENLEYTVLYTWWPPMDRNHASAVNQFLVFNLNPIKDIDSQDEEIVYHEVIHTLSARQTPEQKVAISNAFQKECELKDSAFIGKHKRALEEPLAVAIGQILFLSEYAPNKLDLSKKLHNNPWADGFSRLAYPIVKSEMDSGARFSEETGKKMGRLCKTYKNGAVWMIK